MKMSGLLKALPLALAVAALSLVTTSCGSSSGSSNPAQIRVINAIPDGPALDIDINRSKIITNLPFRTVQPAGPPATYLTVPSGSVTIQGFATGTTTNPIAPNGTIALKASTQYMAVAVGLELNDSPPLVLTDNNTVPTADNVEFRIVNASPSSPTNGVDVYIVPPAVQDLTNFTPQVSGLTNSQASTYQSLPFLAGGYAVIVTANGSKMALITQPSTSNTGSITTLVIVDNAGGNNGMSQTPLVLNDLN